MYHSCSARCIHCGKHFKSMKLNRAKTQTYGPVGLGVCVCPLQSPKILELCKEAQPPPPLVVRQTKDTSYFRNLTIGERKVSVNDVVARFFYANAIPFNASDSDEYNNMCIALSSQPPTYHPPQRKVLCTTLLQRYKSQFRRSLRR